jgi:SAM-dependent methyltransferase
MTMEYTRYYRKWHPDTPEHYKEMQNYYKVFLAPYLPEEKDIKILEIGCGMGFCLLALQELGYKHIEGIDVDPGQIQVCKNKNLDVRLIQDSEEYLSNKQSDYDLILAFDVLEHIYPEKQLPLVLAIFNILKRNGLFLCTVPNANSCLASRWRYIDWTHKSSFTECSLDFLLYNGGFQKISIFPIEVNLRILTRYPFRKSHWRGVIRKILKFFFRIFYRLQLFVELGDEAWKIPLSLNILGVAKKE